MRDRIIAATIDEVNLHGLKFTMNSLAKRLKISKRSLYENFPSKQNLVSSALTFVLNSVEKQEIAIYTSDLPILDKLKAILTIIPQETEPFDKHIYEDLKNTFPHEWDKVETARKIRMQRIETILKQGINTGIIRNVNIAVVQEIFNSSLDSFLKYKFLNSNNITYNDAVTAMLDVIINGLQVTNNKNSN